MDTREFSNKLSRFRRRLLTYASGRVLEVGVGTGANIPYYRGDVTELIGVDWSDKMLMKAFENIDDAKTKELQERRQNPFGKSEKHSSGAQQIKLMRDDCSNLKQFEDGSFDCVVSTFVLNSCFDRKAVAKEMKRLCKSDGYILLLERGSSKLSLYNSWLSFKAARDLMKEGTVEHLDFD